MNSKQRRVRIRAGMPGALRRLSILCLLGDIDPGYAADLKGALNISKLSLAQFESLVQCIGVVERRAERERTIKSYITSTGSATGRMFSSSPVFQSMPRSVGANPNLGAGYSGKAAYTIVFDEVTTIK